MVPNRIFINKHAQIWNEIDLFQAYHIVVNVDIIRVNLMPIWVKKKSVFPAFKANKNKLAKSGPTLDGKKNESKKKKKKKGRNLKGRMKIGWKLKLQILHLDAETKLWRVVDPKITQFENLGLGPSKIQPWNLARLSTVP